MSKKRGKILKAILIAIILIVLGCLIYRYVGIVMIIKAMFIPSNPPKPEIKYGEFPITITYEVDGEIKILQDTIICEFDGFEMRGEAGKYRKWKSNLKSENDSLTLLSKEEENIIVEIAISRGMPEYYMGDFMQSKEEYERVMMDNRYLGCVKVENGVKNGYLITKEEAWQKYKLKIIDIQYSEPIENSFK